MTIIVDRATHYMCLADRYQSAFDDLCTKYLELRSAPAAPATEKWYAEYVRVMHELDDNVGLRDAQIARLRDEICSLNKECCDHAKDVVDLKAELDEAYAAARAERNKRSEVEDEVAGLQAEIRELRRWPPKWLQDYDDLKAERDALREKLDDCRLQRDRYLNERDALDVKMNAFREENSRLAAQLQPLYGPRAVYESLEYQSLEEKHRQLNSEWLNAHNENKRLTQELEKVRSLNIAMHANNEALRAARGLDAKTIETLRKQATELRTELAVATKRADANWQECENLRAKPSGWSYKTDYFTLSAKYDELSAKYDELVAYHNTARAEGAAKLGAFDRIVDLVSPYVEEA